MTMTNKYRNVRTEIDGITFDSKAEAARYTELKLLKQSGAIVGFCRQPSFVLEASGTRYRPDFLVCDGEKIWAEDVKGMETRDFKLKKKIWDKEYPWLPLVIIK
jgi:hypothetical protein